MTLNEILDHAAEWVENKHSLDDSNPTTKYYDNQVKEMRRNKIKAKKSTKSETSSEDREKVEKILEDMKNGKKGYQLKTEDFEVLERFYGHNWQCIVFEQGDNMKVIVAGSRSIIDYNIVYKAIMEAKIEKITEIVSGTAKGVDQMGERWAKENNIPIKKFPANWKNLEAPGAVIKRGPYGEYNVKAGFDRNKQMAEYAEVLICIIQNNSSGSASMIKLAEEHGLQVFVTRI